MHEGGEWLFGRLSGGLDEADGSVKRFGYANHTFHKNSVTRNQRSSYRVGYRDSRKY